MNLIYVIQLMCWNYLIDLITDNRNRNSKNRSSSIHCSNKEGHALRARPLLFPSLLLLLFLLFLFLLSVIRSIR